MSSAYYHTPESVREYISLAKDVSGAQLIDQLKNILKEGAAVLEIGSGPGTDWKLLSDQYQVTGSDLSKEFLKHLRAKYPEGTFLELNASTLAVDQTFEGIYSNKVLHHLSDQELSASIQRQHQILRTNGIICHSFWKGEGDETFKGMYVNYHEEAALRKVLEEHFEVLLMMKYQEFEADDSLLVIAQKK